MNTTTQTEIFARIIRHEKNWSLVAFHKLATVERVEGLQIKNLYGMKPVPYGYEGYIPVSVFEEIGYKVVGGKSQ